MSAAVYAPDGRVRACRAKFTVDRRNDKPRDSWNFASREEQVQTRTCPHKSEVNRINWDN